MYKIIKLPISHNTTIGYFQQETILANVLMWVVRFVPFSTVKNWWQTIYLDLRKTLTDQFDFVNAEYGAVGVDYFTLYGILRKWAESFYQQNPHFDEYIRPASIMPVARQACNSLFLDVLMMPVINAEEMLDDQLDDRDDLPSTTPRYEDAKEDALILGKKMHNATFIETLCMVFEESRQISSGRAAELLEMIIHLLRCRNVCIQQRHIADILNQRSINTSDDLPVLDALMDEIEVFLSAHDGVTFQENFVPGRGWVCEFGIGGHASLIGVSYGSISTCVQRAYAKAQEFVETYPDVQYHNTLEKQHIDWQALV